MQQLFPLLWPCTFTTRTNSGIGRLGPTTSPSVPRAQTRPAPDPFPTKEPPRPTTATAPAGGSTDLTVTFNPLVAQAYSGNIMVTSDATSGTGIIAVTGNGVTSDPSLVADFHFDGDAADSSGYANNGTVVGGVTFVDGVNGKAASFNGTDAYIEVPNSPSLGVTTALTISMWINQGEVITHETIILYRIF